VRVGSSHLFISFFMHIHESVARLCNVFVMV
jgi:hypothetical protein